MPQITCPNCGMTISLENRKEIDTDLIKMATKKGPRTFTELLHITKLSRKTLSLRLKTLCEEGAIVKKEGLYKLNGGSEFNGHGGNFVRDFSRIVHDRRIRTGLMLITFLLFSSASGYVLGAFLIPEAANREPPILGNFTMALDISSGVKDLYSWQVVMAFNSSEVKVLDIVSSGLIGSDFPFFLNTMNADEGTVMFGGTLLGTAPGVDGPGRLATITFGYFVNQYKAPAIVSGEGRFQTLLLNSEGSNIFVENFALTLNVIQNP